MTIHKAKSSNYDKVDTKNIVRYISEYTAHIYGMVYAQNDKLATTNRSELKAIAAELETVQKRLEYIINGRY